jgi:AmmeMemoRadiSam system protein B
MNTVRNPAVAGQFYPADSPGLEAAVTTLLGETAGQGGAAPKALIVPHAGYMYSGPVAASAYARLRPWRDRYSRVVLLGPCHRVPLRGMALSSADAFRTPLGDVAVDHETTARLDVPGLAVSDTSHEYEHSLEVHLPFLQEVLDEFVLVPVVVGDASAQEVAGLLKAVWGGEETLIVISSDLSHYLGYDEAAAKDAVTCTRIENLDTDISHDQACGATPIRGLLLVAKQRGLTVTTLDLRNSGDVAGDRKFVVGYGAWAFA